MDRVKIKEHIIRNLRDKIANQNYSITGEYPENTEAIAIVVSIAGERSVLGRVSGRISFDYATNTEKTLYVYMLTIGFTVYTPVDEEAVTICGQIRDIINMHRHTFINFDLGVNKVFDVGPVAAATMREQGGRKTWAAQVTFDLQVVETIESVIT